MMMAKRFGWSFEPHLVPERLDEPFWKREPAVITPVSVGDLFGLSLPQFREVWRMIELADWHVYALLTKLPNVALDYLPLRIKGKIWFGVTVNTQKDVWRLDLMRKLEGVKKYCLFEPLYGPIDYDLSFLDLVVIGPQNYPTLQPKREWVEGVVKKAGKARVYLKSKLNPL